MMKRLWILKVLNDIIASAFIYELWEKYRREKEGELRKEWDFVSEKVLKLLPV